MRQSSSHTSICSTLSRKNANILCSYKAKLNVSGSFYKLNAKSRGNIFKWLWFLFVCFGFETHSHSVVQAGFKFAILLPQPAKGLNYGYSPNKSLTGCILIDYTLRIESWLKIIDNLKELNPSLCTCAHTHTHIHTTCRMYVMYVTLGMWKMVSWYTTSMFYY